MEPHKSVVHVKGSKSATCTRKPQGLQNVQELADHRPDADQAAPAVDPIEGPAGDGSPDNEIGGNPNACPHCLLDPCIVTQCANARWIGQGHAASDQNSSIRRGIYYRFWSSIANLHGWNDPLYIVRKIAKGQGRQGVENHRREVMPKCVLKHVRGMYPNPDGIPYMEHKWE